MKSLTFIIIGGAVLSLSPTLTPSHQERVSLMSSASAAAPKGLAGVKSLTKSRTFIKAAHPRLGAFNGAARGVGKPRVLPIKTKIKFVKKGGKKDSGDPPPAAANKIEGPRFKPPSI